MGARRTVTLVSIVVPAYNAEPFLPALLESLIGQTETGWECVVVDDGSSDRTAVVAAGFVRRDARFRLVQQENGGASSARNTGFRHTSPATRYVTFMDADDVWLPIALRTLLDHLEGDDRAVGSHGLAEFVDSCGDLIQPGAHTAAGRARLGLRGRRLVTLPVDEPTDFSVLINGNVLFPPGLVLVRRAAYEKVGPFDESFVGAEDWDMLIRLSRFGHFVFTNGVILHYRRHDSNLGAKDSIAEQAWLVRCKAFYSPENSAEQRVLAKRGWRAYQRLMISTRLGEARASFGKAEVRAGFVTCVRAVVHAGRFVRGYPRPKVVSSPSSW